MLCEECKVNGFFWEGYDVDYVVEIKDDFLRCLDIMNFCILCCLCYVMKIIYVWKWWIKNSMVNENGWGK